jgi:hypothetical protein
MSQVDTISQLSSQRIIAGRIAQQTSECAYFISNYWEESFCKSSELLHSAYGESYTVITGKRLKKNAVSDADDLIKRYNDALDTLMRQFQNQAILDVADLVRCTSKNMDVLLTLHPLIPLQVTNWAPNWISALCLTQQARD